MSCQNPSEKVSFEWSDPMILFVHAVRSLIELYRHPITSVGTAPVCQVGGHGFKQRPDQQPGSLKNWWDHVNLLAVIWDLVSVQVMASLCGDVKPFALSPSSFCHWSKQRGRKRTHSTVRKKSGKLSRWCGLPFTHHTSFISWAMGGLDKAHRWIDSGCHWRLCMLKFEL